MMKYSAMSGTLQTSKVVKTDILEPCYGCLKFIETQESCLL